MTITKSKVIEEQMFKDKEIIIKNICYWFGKGVDFTTIFCQDNIRDY
jgi:hypothetical protein